MTKRPNPTYRSEKVVRRMQKMRQARGWSAQRLANLLSDQGLPISRGSIAGLECGVRKHVSVDELFALAGVFQVAVADLLGDGPVCRTCQDQPPAGFACLNCGAGAG